MTRTGTPSALGLAMRFNVTVDGLDLGDWSSCSGLEVKAKLFQKHNPGDYSYEKILFADVVYEPVKLERAIDARSENVRRWVADNLSYTSQPGWSPLDGLGGGLLGSLFGGQTAVITLLDAAWRPVTTWELANVFPKAWRGPSFSASKAAVATETLELAHEGFL